MFSPFSSLYKKRQNNNWEKELIDNVRSSAVSIIVSCRNEKDTVKNTIDSIMNSKNKTLFEIIIVDDKSNDGSCDFINNNKDIYGNVTLIFSDNIGVAASRNLGATIAKGKYLFFCDAHISVQDYWIDNLVKTLDENNAHAIVPVIKNMKAEERGYGGTWNNKLEFVWLNKPENSVSEIPLAPGCTLGIKKDVFDTIGGFDSNLQIYGVEDQEISLKLWLFGYKIVIDTQVEVNHLFKVNNSYKITYADIIYNYLCLVYFHFDDENIAKAIELLKTKQHFNLAFSKLIVNEELLKQRKEYFGKRKFDENYFLKKFNIIF